jgi:hypothetical protein
MAFYRQAIVQGAVWGSLGESLVTLFGGFALSMMIGVPIGILMGRVRIVENVSDPYVSFLYALPHASLVPLMVILLGFELKFRLAYVIVSAVFPVIINTMTGVKNVDPDLLDTGDAFCATERRKLWTIVLPSCTPYIFAGARQAFSAAWGNGRVRDAGDPDRRGWQDLELCEPVSHGGYAGVHFDHHVCCSCHTGSQQSTSDSSHALAASGALVSGVRTPTSLFSPTDAGNL